MPFSLGKHINPFQAFERKNNMFYPKGIGLSKKEKLGMVWLASNYDPEKYKKMISVRDCEATNITKICYSIMNPPVPFALRLSAQLLLGTVRIHRMKTKLCLELAEQTMFKLTALIREANTRSKFDLQIASLRVEAITLADVNGVGGMIDYSLEPVYYDAQMIMHMNEDDFFSTKSCTPMHSPIKINKQKKEDEKLKSPLTVSNRQISIEEDLLSPTKPIQVPGEDAYIGGFGPAQAEFLSDLNFGDLAELKPRDDCNGRLTPVFENQNEMIDSIENSRKRKILDNHPRVVCKLNMDMEPSHMDVEPPNIDLVQQIEPSLYALQSIDMEVEPAVNKTNFVVPEEISVNDDKLLMSSIFQSGKKNDKNDNENVTAVGVPKDWAEDLFTPADAITLTPKDIHPRKKRKQAIDKTIIMEGHEIRTNLLNPESLTFIPIIAGSALPNSKELFKLPIVTNMKFNHRRESLWKKNTLNRVNPELHINLELHDEKTNAALYVTTTDEDDITLAENREITRANEETPANIEIARDGSISGLRSFDHSTGSMVLVNQTPVIEEGSMMKSYDEIIEEHGDMRSASPRISDIGPLPQDIEVSLSNIPDLEPVMEEDEDGVNDASENDPETEKRFTDYLQKIYSELKTHNDVTFEKLFPHQKTKRKTAALAFYALLHMHKNNRVKLEQLQVFGEINITRCVHDASAHS